MEWPRQPAPNPAHRTDKNRLQGTKLWRPAQHVEAYLDRVATPPCLCGIPTAQHALQRAAQGFDLERPPAGAIVDVLAARDAHRDLEAGQALAALVERTRKGSGEEWKDLSPIYVTNPDSERLRPRRVRVDTNWDRGANHLERRPDRATLGIEATTAGQQCGCGQRRRCRSAAVSRTAAPGRQ